MAENQTHTERSILNAVAGTRTDVEQLQADVDKLRATATATLLVGCYALAISALVCLAVLKLAKVAS